MKAARSLVVEVCKLADLWIELAYMLRRVEHINREVDVGESPWCTMQTAIYHQFLQIKDEPDSHSERFISKPTGSKSVFLLIEPSKRAETQFGLCLDRDKSDQSLALSPWKLHRILVEDSLRAWADYMDYLDRRLGDEVSLKGPNDICQLKRTDEHSRMHSS